MKSPVIAPKGAFFFWQVPRVAWRKLESSCSLHAADRRHDESPALKDTIEKKSLEVSLGGTPFEAISVRLVSAPSSLTVFPSLEGKWTSKGLNGNKGNVYIFSV